MNTLTSPAVSPVQSGDQSSLVKTRPYVVSADIQVLLATWAVSRGFVLPDKHFFSELRSEFSVLMKSVFPEFLWVSEEELASGLQNLTSSAREPLLSLERAYHRTPYRLEVCRTVDDSNTDAGLYARSGAPRLHTQLDVLRHAGVSAVSIVDDVIFSGGFLLRILGLFNKVGIKVVTVYTGIAIGEGMSKIWSEGYRVKCVRFFPEVIDEICERDFFPGVPLSGRTRCGDGNIGVPYILPFGLMEKWASVPKEYEVAVSRRCIELTTLLFREIGRVSGRAVRCTDLDRGVAGIPSSTASFVAELERCVS